MPQPYKRADRVGDLVQRVLGDLLLRGVKDPRLHGVTITGVRMSPDLRHARVRFSCGPDPARQAAAREGLLSAAGYLRGVLGRELHLRSAPELAFDLDESLEHSLHIAALLKRVAAEGEPDA